MTWQPDLFPPLNYTNNWPHTYATNVAEAKQAKETHRRPTQAGRILAYLREGNRLTALEALERFGCFRLAARVHELRREGHAIRERTVETRGGKRVAEYSL